MILALVAVAIAVVVYWRAELVAEWELHAAIAAAR